jgi:hypothetical protein
MCLKCPNFKEKFGETIVQALLFFGLF